MLEITKTQKQRPRLSGSDQENQGLCGSIAGYCSVNIQNVSRVPAVEVVPHAIWFVGVWCGRSVMPRVRPAPYVFIERKSSTCVKVLVGPGNIAWAVSGHVTLIVNRRKSIYLPTQRPVDWIAGVQLPGDKYMGAPIKRADFITCELASRRWAGVARSYLPGLGGKGALVCYCRAPLVRSNVPHLDGAGKGVQRPVSSHARVRIVFDFLCCADDQVASAGSGARRVDSSNACARFA